MNKDGWKQVKARENGRYLIFSLFCSDGVSDSKSSEGSSVMTSTGISMYMLLLGGNCRHQLMPQQTLPAITGFGIFFFYFFLPTIVLLIAYNQAKLCSESCSCSTQKTALQENCFSFHNLILRDVSKPNVRTSLKSSLFVFKKISHFVSRWTEKRPVYHRFLWGQKTSAW